MNLSFIGINYQANKYIHQRQLCFYLLKRNFKVTFLNSASEDNLEYVYYTILKKVINLAIV